jgi:4-hydroxy-tetrahydrodipicolinate synthase
MLPFQTIKEALQTVSAIPVTPFEPGGHHVDWAAYRRIIQQMIARRMTVITPNGNTGEFYALSPDERYQAVETACDSAGPAALVMAGVGFELTTAIPMSRAAGLQGAGAVMIHQPVHPYQSAEGWIAYHQAIAETLPELAFVLYIRDPAVTGAMIRRLVESCPNVVGVKFGVPNVHQFASLVQEVGPDRLAWICGLAEMWAPYFWLAGARGFTSGLANVRPDLSLALLACLRAGDYSGAMRLWAWIKPFEDLRARWNNGNNVAVIKEALAQLGYCHRVVRPPLSLLSESEQAEVGAILARWTNA